MTKVLVVDDEKDIRELLIDDLLDSGYQVIEAENGAEALDRVYNDRPDIVLLDLMMPVMNGIEVLKTLKSNPDTANLPVLILTAVSAEEAEQRTMDLGANHYVTKPWGPGTIQTMIRMTLREAAKGGEKSAAGPGGEQADVADLVGEGTNETNWVGDRMNEANRARKQVDGSALISTEDPLLNIKLGGGVPYEGLTYIEGATATGKSVLCQRFAYPALVHGHGVSCINSQHNSSSLNSQMAPLGMNSSHFYGSGKLMAPAIPNVDP